MPARIPYQRDGLDKHGRVSGRLEHLSGSVIGFRNLVNIARYLLERANSSSDYSATVSAGLWPEVDREALDAHRRLAVLVVVVVDIVIDVFALGVLVADGHSNQVLVLTDDGRFSGFSSAGWETELQTVTRLCSCTVQVPRTSSGTGVWWTSTGGGSASHMH